MRPLASHLSTTTLALGVAGQSGRHRRFTYDAAVVPSDLLTLARAAADAAGLRLQPGANGLLALSLADGTSVQAAGPLLATPRPGAHDPLWRAVLAGRERIIDATAGLGADAFHLAGKGANVTLIERSPVLTALLADALAAANAGRLGEAAAAAAARIELLHGDAVDLLTGEAPLRAAVVYLDPMFGGVTGSSAPPKAMAVLRRLLPAESEPAAAQLGLLEAARAAASRRVVVKRALKATPLAGVEPSGSLRGRTVRYDLYAPT